MPSPPARPPRSPSPPLCAANEELSSQSAASFLQLIVPPFLGSTALLSLLMSSTRISTLCAGRSWQCEGTGIATAAGLPSEYNLRYWAFNGSSPEYDSYPERLRAYGRVWDLSRPVLVDKCPGPTYRALPLVVEALRHYQPQMLPGVASLSQAYIVMWAPWCVWRLFGSAVTSTSPEGESVRIPEHEIAEHALRANEKIFSKHLFLLHEGAPTLLLSYADLLWRTEHTVERLLRFMPCIGGLDPDFAPRLGVDVFVDNSWKVHGSVRCSAPMGEPTLTPNT